MIAEAIFASATVLMVTVVVFRRGLRTAWVEWLRHREAMHAAGVEEEVVRTVQAYAMDLHEKLIELMIDVRARTNSEVGS